jgi:transposase-like protein
MIWLSRRHLQSQVSRLCTEIDEKVKAFLSRPIEADWPYLWIDGCGRAVARIGRRTVGVNNDGRREVLGMESVPPKPSLLDAFLRKLARRGLRSSLGKVPTTSVRLLIWPSRRSIGLVRCNLARCWTGKLTDTGNHCPDER